MTVDTRPNRGLGRGLEALIPSMAEDERPREISIDDVVANPYQPRRQFDDAGLADLAESIREHGLLQPVLVTAVEGGYQLIAGERRLRAAKQAGLTRIPALVRSADQQQQLGLALVENLQRADLNAMDEAQAFRRLIDEFGLTQEQVAGRVGRSRPSVANTLRLLDTSPSVQQAVMDGRISEGHARALGSVDEPARQDELLAFVVARELSVRDTERLAREVRDTTTSSPVPPAETPSGRDADPDLEQMEKLLRDALATKVRLQPGARGGRITITYFDADDLARLVDRLAGGAR
jgi:ParB family transcriptional regulator, chromosome partitioning protein